MVWQRRGARKGAKRLPEPLRRKVLRNHPRCWFAFPGICTGKSTQVHHVCAAEDGGSDDYENLVGACAPCHTRHSAQESQQRAVAAAWDWQRKPERHPGASG